MTRDKRDELRRLLAEATAQPWRVEPITYFGARTDCADVVGPERPQWRKTGFVPADAALIVATVNALPGLLDELDAAEAELARLRTYATGPSEWDSNRSECCAASHGKECDRHAALRLEEQRADLLVRAEKAEAEIVYLKGRLDRTLAREEVLQSRAERSEASETEAEMKIADARVRMHAALKEVSDLRKSGWEELARLRRLEDAVLAVEDLTARKP